MKKTRILLATIASLALLGTGCSKTTTNTTPTANTNIIPSLPATAEPMKYKDFKIGITLYYPSNWKSQRQDNNMIFYPQNQDLSQKTSTNLALSTQDLSSLPAMTLDEYTEIIKADTLKRMTNANIISTEKTTVGGLEAGVMTYTANYPDITDKTMEVRHVYVLKDSTTAYLLTYTATSDNFDSFLPQAKQIANSFKFDN